ncbi:MAG: hypothetical protein K2X66_06870 [Cyanobacteria bacterium]|nr:hypothetical protein [Cyanobacteriota bacterium]
METNSETLSTLVVSSKLDPLYGKFNFYCDGETLGQITRNKETIFTIQPGTHILHIELSSAMPRVKSKPIEIQYKSGEIYKLEGQTNEYIFLMKNLYLFVIGATIFNPTHTDWKKFLIEPSDYPLTCGFYLILSALALYGYFAFKHKHLLQLKHI